jgi:hypothetical protein
MSYAVKLSPGFKDKLIGSSTNLIEETSSEKIKCYTNHNDLIWLKLSNISDEANRLSIYLNEKKLAHFDLKDCSIYPHFILK